jgi:hypothetical protein
MYPRTLAPSRPWQYCQAGQAQSSLVGVHRIGVAAVLADERLKSLALLGITEQVQDIVSLLGTRRACGPRISSVARLECMLMPFRLVAVVLVRHAVPSWGRWVRGVIRSEGFRECASTLKSLIQGKRSAASSFDSSNTKLQAAEEVPGLPADDRVLCGHGVHQASLYSSRRPRSSSSMPRRYHRDTVVSGLVAKQDVRETSETPLKHQLRRIGGSW